MHPTSHCAHLSIAVALTAVTLLVIALNLQAHSPAYALPAGIVIDAVSA